MFIIGLTNIHLKSERNVEVAFVEPLHLPLLPPRLSVGGEEVAPVVVMHLILEAKDTTTTTNYLYYYYLWS